MPPQPTQYLLFSDVHLGSDLVQHARPWTASRLAEVRRLDRDLSSMLAHYRAQADPARPWTLIIAGDLVDFMGMSISPDPESLVTPLTDEEQAHGLGSADDHAAAKMRAVARRHALVFDELARFVADGHSLVLVRGNHDVEFYWEGPRRAFVETLTARAGDAVGDPAARAAFEERIAFRHWFFYVEGLLYVEHGHQYDAACCYPNVLSPLSPRDPRRIWYSFSDILLRYVVRPTRGMSSEGHERTDLPFYLRLAFSMGVDGCARLGHRFGRAVLEMFRNWRDHGSERARELRDDHERRLPPLAERFRLSADKLRALAGLWARPVTGGFFTILRSVFLDLLVATGAAALLIAALAVFRVVPVFYLPLLATLLGTGVYVWIKSARAFDPRSALREGARRVAELLPTRFVVMGHTHEARMESVGSGATYINLGGWAVDDLDENMPPYEPGYTHLVIREVDGEHHAELRRWRSEAGPSTLGCASDEAGSGVHTRLDGADDASTRAA